MGSNVYMSEYSGLCTINTIMMIINKKYNNIENNKY